jgi:exonuclease VII small subunit
MSNDAESDSSMEKFEDVARRLFRVAKDDLEKAEREVEEIIEDALGPPPAQGPAVAEDED